MTNLVAHVCLHPIQSVIFPRGIDEQGLFLPLGGIGDPDRYVRLRTPGAVLEPIGKGQDYPWTKRAWGRTQDARRKKGARSMAWRKRLAWAVLDLLRRAD